MAGNIKGITIEFKGETSSLEQAIKKVNSSTKEIDRNLKDVNRALKFNPTSVELWRQKQDLLKAKIAETKNNLTDLKAVQAQMDANNVSKESMEYQKLQREIIETESKLKTFEGQLKQVGNVNLRAASEQFKQWGQSLESAGQKMQGLSMAAAGVVASLGAISYKAGQSADDLNTMSKVYNINTQDLQKYKATADLVDVSVETIAKSHTKLEKSMYSAQNGSKTMGAAFQTLGVDIVDANGNLRDSDAVWQDAIVALGKMENETERDAIAMQLMGKSAAELNPLIEDGGKTYKNVAETMKKYGLDYIDQETLDKANEFNDELDTMKMIGSVAIAQVGSQLAAYLAPALEKVVTWVGKFANWLSKLSPEVLTVIGVVAGFVAALAPVLMFLGKISFAISSIMSLMSTLGPMIAGIAGPIGIAIAAIVAIIAIGVLLYKNWDTIKAKAIEIKNKLIQTWNNIKASITATMNALKSYVVNAWKNIKTDVSTAVTNLKSTISTAWDNIKSKISTAADNIKSKLSGAWDSIKTTATTAWDSVKSAIVTPIKEAKDKVSDIVGKLKDKFPLSLGKLISFSIPTITLKTGSKTVLGKTITYPTGFNVSWHANGGIFASPTLLTDANGGVHGIGEAGAEAVIPLDRFWEEIRNSNARTDALLARQNQILIAVLEEVSKEKNFKVDGIWAGRYVNSLVR